MKISPEFLPLIEWWEKDGKQIVMWLAAAAVIGGGWYAWQARKAYVKNAAAEQLVNAYPAEELEEAVSKYADTASGGALKLRLAKNYFDAARYEEALAIYEGLEGCAPDGFADVPAVGKAQCLEALGRFADAEKAFDAFAEANPKSCLKLTAQLGAARVAAQAGDKKKALARLDALKAANKGDELALERIDSTVSVVKRWEKKSPEAVKSPEKKSPEAKK
jgi:predicted negative regulator of RcsB-dependent stress response